MTRRAARDKRLLDAVEALPAASFCGSVWRVVRDGRDPVQCSAVGGRWDDTTFEVLYTSTHADGACSELYFHLGRGQPVLPSLMRYRLFELNVALAHCIQLARVQDLGSLGLQTSLFGQLAYAE